MKTNGRKIKRFDRQGSAFEWLHQVHGMLPQSMAISHVKSAKRFRKIANAN